MNNTKIIAKVDNKNHFIDPTFQLTWPGKQEALLSTYEKSTKKMIPLLNESHEFCKTKNLFIEGDNLEALKILLQDYSEKIKLIYLDPPYNTGNKFLYNDNFIAKDLLHSNAKIHTNWLNMMYPRLLAAKKLLCKEGMILISIDDHELHYLKVICDEIFGEKNFVGTIVVNTTPNARDYGHLAKMHEYILFYAKNIKFTKTNLLEKKDLIFKFKDTLGEYNLHPLYNSNEGFTPNNRPNLYYPFFFEKKENETSKQFFEITLENNMTNPIFPPKSEKNSVQFVWRWGKEKAKKHLNKEIIGYKNKNNQLRIMQKMRHTKKRIRSILSDKSYTSRAGTAELEALFKTKLASFPKPLALIKTLIKMATNDDDIILDFFAGTATTAHATMAVNLEDHGKRIFILIQNSEPCEKIVESDKYRFTTIAEMSKERIRLAINQIKISNTQNIHLDLGFKVFKIY